MIENIILFMILIIALMLVALVYGVAVLKAEITEVRLSLDKVHRGLIEVSDDLRTIRQHLSHLEIVFTALEAKP